MKFYKTDKWKNEIVAEREVERQTESSIFWTSERGRNVRELKVTSYGVWHPSKEEALEYLRGRIEKNIEYTKSSLVKLESDLNKIISQQSAKQ